MASIATTTLYERSDEVRFPLALDMFKKARDWGYKVFVVDSSPDHWVREAFEDFGVIFLPATGSTMGSKVRQSIMAALKKDRVIVRMEPEKAPLVPLLGEAISIMNEGKTDLIIPRRNNLDSYPLYQQVCELRGNWQAGTFTGRPDLDLWFGPRIMNRRGAELFLEYPGDHGDHWDSIFAPIPPAIDRYKVRSIPVDYQHPPSQTAAETGDEAMNRKRDQQLRELVDVIRFECGKLGLPRL